MFDEVERSAIKTLLQTWAWITLNAEDQYIASHAFKSLVKELGCRTKARLFVLQQCGLPTHASNDAIYRRSIS